MHHETVGDPLEHIAGCRATPGAEDGVGRAALVFRTHAGGHDTGLYGRALVEQHARRVVEGCGQVITHDAGAGMGTAKAGDALFGELEAGSSGCRGDAGAGQRQGQTGEQQGLLHIAGMKKG